MATVWRASIQRDVKTNPWNAAQYDAKHAFVYEVVLSRGVGTCIKSRTGSGREVSTLRSQTDVSVAAPHGA